MPVPQLLAAGGSLLGGFLGLSANRKKRRAARARRQINKIQNFQAKRKFVNDFLNAQSVALARGSLTGADLGSSGVQGELASQRTQATTGLLELREQTKLGAFAARQEQKASRLQGAASFVSNAAPAFGSLYQEFQNSDGTAP